MGFRDLPEGADTTTAYDQLVQIGYDVTPDNWREALKMFQKQFGVDQDGNVGPLTQQLLNAAVKPENIANVRLTAGILAKNAADKADYKEAVAVGKPNVPWWAVGLGAAGLFYAFKSKK